MTTPAIRRPRVFISSTIADLRDVRSALRYWLEQASYDVQLSEYNDFERAPAADVIEACMNNVASADLYILIIGRNRGSALGKNRQITMTRQEFRTAAEAAKRRTLGICVFVREEVSVALEQWKRSGGEAVETRYVEDPEFTSAFLEEVSKPPSRGKSNRWVYKFSDFRDIADTLRVVLRLESNFEEALLRRNLLEECLHNLTLLVTRSRDSIQTNHGWGTHVRNEITIREEDVGGGRQHLTDKQLQRLGMLFFARPREGLRHGAMDEALSRGLFLEFDSDTKQLEATVQYEALRALREDMVDFESFRDSEFLVKAIGEFLVHARNVNSGRLTGGTDVDTDNLTMVLSLHDRMENIFVGLAKMVGWLLGTTDAPTIERKPKTPIPTFAQQIEKEHASPGHIRWAIEGQVFPFGTNLTPQLREAARQAEQGHFESLRRMIPEDLASDERVREMITDSFDRSVVEPYEPPPPTVRRLRRR